MSPALDGAAIAVRSADVNVTSGADDAGLSQAIRAPVSSTFRF
jgi:hypothetical protein